MVHLLLRIATKFWIWFIKHCHTIFFNIINDWGKQLKIIEDLFTLLVHYCWVCLWLRAHGKAKQSESKNKKRSVQSFLLHSGQKEEKIRHLGQDVDIASVPNSFQLGPISLNFQHVQIRSTDYDKKKDNYWRIQNKC